MTKLSRLNGRELIAALGKAGFTVVRVRGSHHILRDADGRTTTVPVHGGEIIGVGLLSRNLRDCDLMREGTHRHLRALRLAPTRPAR